MIDSTPFADGERPHEDPGSGHDGAAGSSPSIPSGPDDDAWAVDDLESAYRRALAANEAVEWEFAQLAPAESDHAGHPIPETAGAPAAGDSGPLPEASAAHDPAAAELRDLMPADPLTGAAPDDSSETPRVTIRQVIEAALFVGGEPLTTRRLCHLLRGDADLDTIELAIDELNRQYLEEARPYEIRLGEGGYRMVLREEFERVRHRVYGIGPREVKLSQDALEVLALVAYRQPVTQEQIEELGKDNPGPVLRQLLRRELITLERDPDDRRRVTYLTTKRFLSLFGLGSLDELPQADDLAFK